MSQISDAAYLEQAAIWSKDLTRMKARGPGDIENAMRKIQQEYGIDYGFMWSLRYRRDRLKKISHAVFDRIQAAYQAECQRQLRKLQDEIIKTEQIAGSDCNSVRAAKTLVGQNLEEDSP